MVRKATDILTFLDETISTNVYLKDLVQLEDLKEGTSVFAEYQKSGRGCGTNNWESEKSQNILFSVIFFPDFIPIINQFILSKITSISILEILKREVSTMNSALAEEFSIKWPNDIYWKNKKIAGILIENLVSGEHLKQSIIGVGININQIDFSENLPNPISLRQILGVSFDRKMLFIQIIHNLHLYYLRLMKKEYQNIDKIYADNLFRKDGFHLFFSEDDGRFAASILGVDNIGRLLLKKTSGEEKAFSFKEISFLNI